VGEVTENALIEAFGLAFTEHYRLVLSPSTIWQVGEGGGAIHGVMNEERREEMTSFCHYDFYYYYYYDVLL